ncbi:MAG TPA: CcmD family protein [Chryseolinea sp.]|nr:CcmD family protein [Chryseolinea sp.]HPH47254.1 CcmD family protein [Chryseolinea sp.]
MRNFKILSLIALILTSFPIFAQGDNSVEMADVLRTNGKIYVVVVGLVIILTGVIIFLLRLEKKLHNLEKKELEDKTKG